MASEILLSFHQDNESGTQAASGRNTVRAAELLVRSYGFTCPSNEVE